MGFLFQSLGCDVDFLDNAATNFNDCEGLRRTASLLGRPQKLIERDIDWGFELDRDYDLAIFLGTLYHLRNPALALLRLAQRCRRALISTRITSHLPDGQNVEAAALAYLLDAREAERRPDELPDLLACRSSGPLLKRSRLGAYKHAHRFGASALEPRRQ